MKIIYVLVLAWGVVTYVTGMNNAESAPQQCVAVGSALFFLMLARLGQAEYYASKQSGESLKDLFVKKHDNDPIVPLP